MKLGFVDKGRKTFKLDKIADTENAYGFLKTEAWVRTGGVLKTKIYIPKDKIKIISETEYQIDYQIARAYGVHMFTKEFQW